MEVAGEEEGRVGKGLVEHKLALPWVALFRYNSFPLHQAHWEQERSRSTGTWLMQAEGHRSVSGCMYLTNAPRACGRSSERRWRALNGDQAGCLLDG